MRLLVDGVVDVLAQPGDDAVDLGVKLGGLLGRWVGERGEQMSGVILILVGAAIAGGALS